MKRELWVGLAVLAAAVGGAVGSPQADAGVAPPTGSIQFNTNYTVSDTRNVPGVKLAANTDQVMPTGALSVTVLDADSAGVATIHPCGLAIDPAADVDLVFDAGEVAKTQITTGGGHCLRSSVAVHVTVVYVGTLGVPYAGGLQYHALPSPSVVFDSDVPKPPAGLASSFPVPLPAGVPSSAESVVYRLDVESPGSIWGTVTRCDNGYVDYSDFSIDDGSTSTIAYRNRTASVASCLYVTGSAPGHVKVTVLGWLQQGGPDPAAVPPELRYRSVPIAPPGLRSVSPTRVLDTRRGIGGPVGPLADDEMLILDLGPYITDTTTSVVMNVTVTAPVAAGFVTVFPCDVDVPEASNLNFVAGQDVPNLVTVPVALDGTVCMVTSARTHLIADLAGTFEFGGGSLGTPVAPERILDTRSGNGAPRSKVGAGSTVTLRVAGRGGLPANGVTAVTMNITVASPEAPGFVTVFPCGQPVPDASNLNFTRNRDVPNLVTVKVSSAGTVCLTSTATTDLIADVAMWFGEGGSDGLYAIAPTRIVDSRQPSPLGFANPRLGLNPAMPFSREVVAATGTSLVDVHAVVMNVTVTRPFGSGFVTIHPCGSAVPNASNLNFIQQQDIPNLVTVKTSAGNQVCFSTSIGTDVLADVAGYFSSATVPAWEQVLVS